jgi:YfiH family protein
LFFDRKNKIIGAAHAGWRGALSNIVDSTVGQMIKHGGERENIIAAIGPCILKHSYEVSKDFRQNFDEESDCFCKVHSKLYFDLPRYCKRKLLMAGLSEENIDILEIDTYANFDKYFSHRYAIKNTNGVGGRNISVICL